MRNYNQIRLVLIAFFLFFYTLCYCQNYDLTGFWQTDNNNSISHFIRQIDNEVYWYMSNPPNTYNIFHGTITGNIITGKWLDLPGSNALNNGALVIRIESNNRLLKLSESGNQRYASTVWTRNQDAESYAAEKGVATTTNKQKLLDEIIVSSLDSQPITSRITLERGKDYIIEARGSYSCGDGLPASIDAAWCYAPRCKRSDPWGELMIDGLSFHTAAGSTIPYRDDHVYRLTYRGKGKQATFGIYDAVVLNSHADNSGGLTVRIYEAK